MAGNVQYPEIYRLCTKWFAPIPSGPAYVKSFPQEPLQCTPKLKIVQGHVPFNMLYKAYHMPGKCMPGYYAVEVLCNLLSEGKSSLLHAELVEAQPICTKIEAYTTDTLDPGLLILSGSLSEQVSFETAEKALAETLQKINSITTIELEKAKNQIESYIIFSQISLVNRAQDLAMATLLGDTNLINSKIEYIRQVSLAEVKTMAQTILKEENCVTLHYKINR